MGALNTFFNARTAHHAKASVKFQRAQARRAQGRYGDANDVVVGLFTRGARRRDAEEKARFAALGASVMSGPVPAYGTPAYEAWYAKTYPDEWAKVLKQRKAGR